MGKWWGPILHREHEDKILAALRQEFGPRISCPKGHFQGWWLGDPAELLVFRISWLSTWEQNQDSHSRIRVTVGCLDPYAHEGPLDQFDLDVSRWGELVREEITLPLAA